MFETESNFHHYPVLMVKNRCVQCVHLLLQSLKNLLRYYQDICVPENMGRNEELKYP